MFICSLLVISLCLPNQGVVWFLCHTVIIIPFETNKQPVGIQFKNMKISCSSSKFPPGLSTHWRFLPEPFLIKMLIKWFSNSYDPFTFTNRLLVFYIKYEFLLFLLLLIYLSIYYQCGFMDFYFFPSGLHSYSILAFILFQLWAMGATSSFLLPLWKTLMIFF